MAERNTSYKDRELLSLNLAAAAKVEGGKMVAVNATGYAIEGADTANIIIMGVADQTIDNTAGADGAKSVRVRRGKAFLLKNSATNPVTQASVGADVYVEDDETVAVAAGPTNDIVAGQCLGVESAGVCVAIG